MTIMNLEVAKETALGVGNPTVKSKSQEDANLIILHYLVIYARRQCFCQPGSAKSMVNNVMCHSVIHPGLLS